jgi:glycosyltransferase involved in cell wall biosynthesis
VTPVRKSKKIAIVCGHFMPEIGYQETYLARAYSRLGYKVRVFSSTAISPTGKKILKEDYETGLTVEPKYGYEVERLPISINLNSKIIANGLAETVKTYQPDYIVIIALAKLFPIKVLSTKYDGAKKIAVFGDAGEYLDRSTASKRFKALFHEVISKNLKKQLYTRAVKECDRIILNLSETESFFRELLTPSATKIFEKKKKNLTLGFDPDNFYFDENERKEIRKELNIPEKDIVVITSTRVNRQKRLEEVITRISQMKDAGSNVRYIIIGFLGDDYEKELKAFIKKQKHPEIFYCLGFLDHETIRKYYNASDLGLWLKAAISIQEAMGTGLKVILENKEVVSHLLTHGVNGWYYEKGKLTDGLKDAINSSLINPSTIQERKKIVDLNSNWLSYDTIAKKIIDDL